MVWIHGVTRLKKIFKIIGNPKKKNEIANEKNHLPRDILFLILSCLSMKDNIRASAVCKTWHDIAVSVRDRSPLLVYFNVDLSGVSYGFFYPREKKTTKAMKLSYQFFDARLCQSKKGWLLLVHNHEGIKRLFFFNPFTREPITLPSLIATGAFGAAEFAFSCAPTSKGCVVCCISNRTPYRFLIHTWNVGAAKWVGHRGSQ